MDSSVDDLKQAAQQAGKTWATSRSRTLLEPREMSRLELLNTSARAQVCSAAWSWAEDNVMGAKDYKGSDAVRKDWKKCRKALKMLEAFVGEAFPLCKVVKVRR